MAMRQLLAREAWLQQPSRRAAKAAAADRASLNWMLSATLTLSVQWVDTQAYIIETLERREGRGVSERTAELKANDLPGGYVLADPTGVS